MTTLNNYTGGIALLEASNAKIVKLAAGSVTAGYVSKDFVDENSVKFIGGNGTKLFLNGTFDITIELTKSIPGQTVTLKGVKGELGWGIRKIVSTTATADGDIIAVI